MPVVLPLVFALSSGCAAGQQYRLPMTAAELKGYGDPAALVAYLSQPGASSSVCDQRAPGPHFAPIDEAARKALSDAFQNGKIAPQLWRRCMAGLLRGADAVTATALVDDVLQATLDTVEDGNLDYDAREQRRLDALLQLYATRGADLAPPAELASGALSALGRDLETKRLGPAGQPRAADLYTLLQLERGEWQGRAVDAHALDALLDARDERTLRWAVDRLHEAALRVEARHAGSRGSAALEGRTAWVSRSSSRAASPIAPEGAAAPAPPAPTPGRDRPSRARGGAGRGKPGWRPSARQRPRPPPPLS